MGSDTGTPPRLGGTPPIAWVGFRAAVPVALLLFPAASVLGYMSRNLAETAVIDVLPALTGATVCAVIVWLIVAVLRGRADAGTAVIAALWVVAGLNYLALFGAINRWIGGDYTLIAALPVALAGLAAATFAVHRLRTLAVPIHIVLSAIAVVMVATPLAQIAAFEWRNGAARAVYDPEAAVVEVGRFAGTPPVGAARPPDIYHIVFDRYGSAETLAETYGVQATIGASLQERGFYVAEASHSNYLKTGQSLASTFYLDYLDLLSDPRIAGASWHPVFAMLDDHRVARILQGFGYDFLQFGSWWKGTHHNARADENHAHGFSEFTMYYLRHTVLRTAIGLFPRSRFAMRLDWDNGQCQRVARQVEQLQALGARQTPVYVFAHFLLPHDPFVFAADGRCLPLDEANARGSVQGYIDQAAYADRIIADLVQTLQERQTPPVILIQADEGPYPERDYAVPWQEAEPKDLRIKTGILNAYYFPDRDYASLYPDISPVNSYRVLFNKYFGAAYPILPDRVIAFPDDAHLYTFHDVTDRVLGGEP
jgi:hypothetical protein